MLETIKKKPTTIPAMETRHPEWGYHLNFAEEQQTAAEWSRGSWRNFTARQQPDWPDRSKVEAVKQKIAALPPLVHAREIRTLKKKIAWAVDGRAFVLQGGDCSENFMANGTDKIDKTCRALAGMALLISLSYGRPLIIIGRMAGQFAKPRSSDTETINGIIYPSYRGDMVNDASLSLEARKPDPGRILKGYAEAQKTLEHLRTIEENHPDTFNRSKIYTSHEALLLAYEEAMIRKDESDGRWYACSGHMLWIGERTRQPDSAHIELLRGVSNPIGVKVGPEHRTKEISELCRILNPDNEAGRLSLITRFGKDRIDELLPPLIRKIKAAGYKVAWITDPMHGNTFTSESGYKTRKYEDILSEIQSFFRIHAQENTIAGGIHLEMTGENVTECLGGICNICDEDLNRKYLTSCDPRLNGKQCLEIAFDVAGIIDSCKK